jgi:hypothetical protein
MPDQTGNGLDKIQCPAKGGGMMKRQTRFPDSRGKLINKLLPALVLFGMVCGTGHVLAADILLITGANFHGSDRAIQKGLESRGHTVTVVQDRRAQIANALDRDLVVISESVYALNIGTTFRNLPVPVVVADPWLFSDMGMTGSNYFRDFGVATRQAGMTIQEAQHELAAGLSGAVSVTYRRETIGWGTPGPAAVKIASLADDPAKCTVFAYQKGDAMFEAEAPAKRVGLFLYGRTASDLTPQGWALVDAAVDWALAPAPARSLTIEVVSDDSWNACAGEGCDQPGWQQIGYDDANWMAACDVFPDLADSPEPVAGSEAGLIWFCPPGVDLQSPSVPPVAFFRKIFNIPVDDPADLKAIQAYVACPGQIDLYVNGTQVLERAMTIGEGGGGRPVDIGSYLVAGDNVLAILADMGESAEKWILLDARIEALVEPADNIALKKALLVTGQKYLQTAERQITTRLEQSGYLVTAVDDRRVKKADSIGMDLIVISESVSSAAVGASLADVAVPIICFDAYLYDDLKMTGARRNTDYGTAYLQKSIVFMGFPGHAAEPATPQKIIQIASRRKALGWGVPSESAAIIATLLHDPGRAVIFAYEKDAFMAGSFQAPARRIGMFAQRDPARRFITADWELFDAAVRWAAE